MVGKLLSAQRIFAARAVRVIVGRKGLGFKGMGYFRGKLVACQPHQSYGLAVLRPE
jgi:hypothetical protein